MTSTAVSAAINAYVPATGHDPGVIAYAVSVMTSEALTVSIELWQDAGHGGPWPQAMTAELARRRMVRTARILADAQRAELTALQLEAFEIQAADAWSRWVTLSGNHALAGP